MRTLVDDYQLNWPDQLLLVEFAMNSAINKSTGYAPFELNYRWMPKLIGGLDFESPREGVKQFVENIRNVLNKTNWSLSKHVRPSRQIDTAGRDKNSMWGI
jgi:hypothetical protein